VVEKPNMSAGFYGEYKHTIDLKGRVFVPRKLKDGLGDEFIVTKGLNNCLFVYSMEGWNIFTEKLKELPISNKKAVAISRKIFAGVDEVTTDKQGRILLKQVLRNYASIDKDVYVLGVGNRVEIWDKDSWEKYDSESGNIEDLAEEMELNNLFI
jgi:MraZ protein